MTLADAIERALEEREREWLDFDPECGCDIPSISKIAKIAAEVAGAHRDGQADA